MYSETKLLLRLKSLPGDNIDHDLFFKERTQRLKVALLTPQEQKIICYRPQTKFAKVMFLQVSICPQGGRDVHGWGDVHGRGGASVAG